VTPIPTGTVYGRLTVRGLVWQQPVGSRNRVYLAECSCLNWTRVRGADLKRGATRSCGCLHHGLVGGRNTTHGLTGHPLYGAWSDMLRRCLNPNDANYARYGGRKTTLCPDGINVCAQWQGRDGFPHYLADVGERPAPGWQLHRVDNDGGYEPSNVRWVTASEHTKIHAEMRRQAKAAS
jgi:hypothetical protein